MKQTFLKSMLIMAKWTGLFHVARRLTSKDLRIITYHGGSVSGEHLFRGGLFISTPVFKSRLELLKKRRYLIIDLEEGIRRLESGTLDSGSVVITLDDGWYSTYAELAPALKRYDFCSTLYISSYYMQKQTAVFNVAVDFLMWKSKLAYIDLHALDSRLSGVFSLQSEHERYQATQLLWNFADSMQSAAERQQLLEKVAVLVDVDYHSVGATRCMSYMTSQEASELSELGMNVQLHTHRHRLPSEDFDQTRVEIEENREALSSFHSQPLKHFCYPSGEYEQWQPEWLTRLGIVSATTTNRGLNRRGQSVLELNRFLDWDHFSNLHFEAEVSGFFELMRRAGVKI